MKKLITAILITTLFSCTKPIQEDEIVKKELIINGKATEFK